MEKKLKLVVLTIAMSMTFLAHAHDIFVDGIYYNIVSEDNLEVEVTYGPEREYENYYQGNVVIPDEITYEEQNYRVVGIGDYAFYGQSELQSLTLGANIRSIAEYNLDEDSLEEINVSSGNSEYCSLDGILYNHDMTTLLKFPQNKVCNSFCIPSSVIRIGDYAMSCLRGVPEIYMTDSVTELGKYCFESAQWGITVHLSANVREIPEGAFMSCGHGQGGVSINLDNVTSIGEDAFAFTKLSKMCAPELNHIGQRAFESCELESVIISDKCKTVPLNAFQNASILKGAYSEDINSVFPEGSRNPFTYSHIGISIDRGYIIQYPAGSKIENENIISADGTVLYYAPTGLTWTEHYITPEDVTTIADYALSYSNAGLLIFRPSVVDISSKALASNGVWYYMIGTRYDSTNDLLSETSNSFYKTIDGVLYDKSGKTLISCPEGLHGQVNGRYEYLNDVTLPSFVENVSDYAFFDTNIKNIKFVSSLKNIGDYAFASSTYGYTIHIPSVTETIGKYAFAQRGALDACNIEQTVSSIGTGAFMNCSSLGHIEIPVNLKEISDNLFLGCTSLENIVIPQGVTKIGKSSFSGCSKLVSASMPNTITEIGDSVFFRCQSLSEIEIPSSVRSVGKAAFYDTKIKDVSLPIIETLGEQAFLACRQLESVKLGDNITDIEPSVFNGCRSLKTVELGNAIKKIDDEAFGGCSGLSEVISHSITPPSLPTPSVSYRQAFPSSIYKTCNLYVPSESLDAYKSNRFWSQSFENILPLSSSSGIGDRLSENSNRIGIVSDMDGIHLLNADGESVSIYSMAGVKIFSESHYSGHTINVDAGIYLVNIGTETFKISAK